MAGCLGVFCALDLFLFFLFFELTIVPLYFLIGRWGHGRKVYAATKFFLFTMFGSAFMLVSIVTLARARPAPATAAPRASTCSRSSRAAPSPQNWGRVLFCGFAIAFMVKTPVFPFHTWLPDAHTEAPTAGSIDLAGVLLKLGTYGFMRYGLYLFPEATVWAAPVMLTLGRHRHHLRRHRRRDAEEPQAAGGLLVGVAHGLRHPRPVRPHHPGPRGQRPRDDQPRHHHRRHVHPARLPLQPAATPTTSPSLKGLQTVAPVFAGLFTIVMLSSIGVPGLNGFVGEFLVAARHVRLAPLVGRRRRHRRDPRRALHAVGLPAGVPRRGRRRQPRHARPQAHRAPRDGAARRC